MRPVLLGCVSGFLGAGKTTAMAAAAREILARGYRVGLVTNDQGQDLVDTAYLRSLGLPTQEVAGGCFCCRFDDLVDRADRLIAETGVDVLLAEAVGSCTDIAATVYRPLRRYFRDRFDLAPLTVLVEPHRLREIEGTAFPDEVAYIFDRQMAEADLVVLNKVDLVEPGQRRDLERGLRDRLGGAPVLGMSASTGLGVGVWVDRLLGGGDAGELDIDVDYAAYARGEAALAWLNATLDVRPKAPAGPRELGQSPPRGPERGRPPPQRSPGPREGPRGHGSRKRADRRHEHGGRAAVEQRGPARPGSGALRHRQRPGRNRPRYPDRDPARGGCRRARAPRGSDRRAPFRVLPPGAARPATQARGAQRAELGETWPTSPDCEPSRLHRGALRGDRRPGREGRDSAEGRGQARQAFRSSSGAVVPYDREDLFRVGAQRSFAGASLGEIAFPLGGIGTGTVSLGGRGQLRDWEIFNRPGKGKVLPFTFVALWARPEGEAARLRVVEGPLQPPYGGGFGFSRSSAQGLPRFQAARFTGAYPFARVDFEDDALPVEVSLEAFNPFVPMDVDDSSLPVAVLPLSGAVAEQGPGRPLPGLLDAERRGLRRPRPAERRGVGRLRGQPDDAFGRSRSRGGRSSAST